MTMYIQGDVAIRKIDKATRGEIVPRDRGRIVLAYGEATGHAHAIHEEEAVLSEVENKRFLEVLKEGGVDLLHEEHPTIHLPPGDYEIVQQRRYDDLLEWQRVAD